MKKLLKTISTIYACAITVIALASCSNHSPETISEGEILDEYNRALKDNATNIAFTEIEVGTYECNDETSREQLRKLQAAGLINYDVERLAWWEKSFKNVKRYRNVTEYIGWYSYQTQKSYWAKETVYDFEDHYIVTVSLTKDGEKIAVKELPEKVKDKDLLQPEINADNYAWNIADLTEEWPAIDNPFIEKPVAKQAPASSADTIAVEEVATVEVTNDDEDNGDKIERKDLAKYEKYVAFSPSHETIYLKAYEIKGTTARYITISKTEEDIPVAGAEVILAIKNVTDAGRIAYGVENDMKRSTHATVHYFLDKGWVIKDND